jgi:hypothetical protein
MVAAKLAALGLQGLQIARGGQPGFAVAGRVCAKACPKLLYEPTHFIARPAGLASWRTRDCRAHDLKKMISRGAQVFAGVTAGAAGLVWYIHHSQTVQRQVRTPRLAGARP